MTPLTVSYSPAPVLAGKRPVPSFLVSFLDRRVSAPAAAYCVSGLGHFHSFIQFPFEVCSSVAGTEQHKGKFNSWQFQPENGVSAKCLM